MSEIIISQGSFSCPDDNVPVSSNECGDIITIQPLYYECNTTGSTRFDGRIFLFISGGTSPYSVTWSDGHEGQHRNDLTSGEYEFTIRDSYGDYVVTDVCVIEGLITPTPTITPTMTPTPSGIPTTPNDLCLFKGDTQYTFIYDSVVDGYYQWVNEEFDMTVYFNINNNRWEVLNWGVNNEGQGDMVMVNSQNLIIPAGNTWYNMNKQWTMFIGECVSELSLITKSNDETCSDSNDGSVLLVASGGDGNYCYRIQGVSPYPQFVSEDIFTNLSSGTYVAEVKDGCVQCNLCDGNTSNNTFTIQEGEGESYVLNITGNILQQSVSVRTVEYVVQINPPLPTDVEVTFDLSIEYSNFYNQPKDNQLFIEPIFNLDMNGLEVPTLSNSTSQPDCNGNVDIITNTSNPNSIIYHNVTLDSSNNVYVNQFSHNIIFDYSWANCNCPAIADSNVTIEIVNYEINDINGCSTLNKQGRIVSYINLQNCLNATP